MIEDETGRVEDLEHQLLEERRERDAAQRRAAQLSENVALWRTRAEERSSRIEKLEVERDRLRGPTGWLRRAKRAIAPQAPRPVGDVTSEPAVDRRLPPDLPGVRCVAITANPDLKLAARMFDTVDFDASVSLMEADVVLADAAGIRALPPDATTSFVEWAVLDVRPPLVTMSDVGPEYRDRAAAVLAIEELTGRFFDPIEANPSLRESLASQMFEGLSSVSIDGFGTVVVDPFDATSTRHVELAASGVPFLDPASALPGVEDVRRTGVQFRRYAYERRSAEMKRFVSQLTIDASIRVPRVAGILVSNRPDLASTAIERLTNQTYPEFEVIVGCHGFASSEVSDALEVLARRVNVKVLEFDAASSLGACLNAAVSETNAEILAKLDDDDHYGPAYLIDAVHALEYSRAEIIGKGANFTYVQAEDRTLLRRPGNEEMFYNGSPTGATLVWTRNAWERNPFSHRTTGEDYAFLRGARRLGHRIYVNSPYEFVYHRRVTGNTWQASDAVFTEGAAPAWDGEQPHLADVPSLDPDSP